MERFKPRLSEQAMRTLASALSFDRSNEIIAFVRAWGKPVAVRTVLSNFGEDGDSLRRAVDSGVLSLDPSREMVSVTACRMTERVLTRV